MSLIHIIEDALPLDVCAEMIEHFEAHPEDQGQGTVSWGLVKPELKRSIDTKLLGDHWRPFEKKLFASAEQIMMGYPQQHWMRSNMRDSGYQIQRTNKGDFYGPHFDTDGQGDVALRQLVMIWYLNDVEKGGCTRFPYQQTTIKPKAGRAVAFPPFWTHLHEGQPVLKGSKYIATTWIMWG